MRVRRAPVCAHLADDMDALAHLVLLCAFACARGERPGEALRRRGRYGVYGGELARDYEPYMFAAFPLHAPVPVLRVVSARPLGARPRDPAPAPSAHRPVYARAPYVDTEYASAAYSDYEPETYEPYVKQYQPEEPTILYARPSPHGGYSYHSSRHQPSKRAPPPGDAPYIMRVHKYRIVKER